MGLSEYKAYKKHKKFISFLSEFGLTEDDFKNIKEISLLKKENAELNERLSMLEKSNATVVRQSEEELKKIKEKYGSGGFTTPEQIVAMFTTENEEYYPNGIGN